LYFPDSPNHKGKERKGKERKKGKKESGFNPLSTPLTTGLVASYAEKGNIKRGKKKGEKRTFLKIYPLPMARLD